MTSPDSTQRQAPPDRAQQAQGPPTDRRAVHRTRMGGAWVAAALFALVLLLLLVFILENSQQVNVGYFGAHGHLPLGVALLLAAVLGILLVVIPGAGRIIQLRRTARRHHKAATAAQQQSPPGTAVEPADSRAADAPPGTGSPAAGDQQAGTASGGQR